MKKLYTLLAGALLVSAAANAQRLVDISATMVAPAANATITSGTAFASSIVIKNVGTTTLKTTDTLLYAYSLNGNLLSFDGSTNPTVWSRTGRQMLPNDTMHIDRNLTFTFPSSLNGAQDFCLVAVLTNRSADSVRDNITTNNQGCNSITFAGGSTSVANIIASSTLHSVTNVFPVPVRNEANFELNLGENTSVSVRVTDLTGRVVAIENKGTMSKGKQAIKISVGDIASGIYLYQIVMGEEVKSGKLVVAK
jgi:hypothetical protein